jgi:2-methylcitrate dehydratase PrpD
MKPLHREHPRAGATARLVEFAGRLKYAALPEDVRHHARRHLLDTIGVMIAGAQGDLCRKAQAVLADTRSGERVPVPGREERASVLDAAFLGGTAAHGIEYDDGFRQGSVHPGCVVVPAVLAAAFVQKASGAALLEAIVAGYETVISIGAACHPALRRRGFHPTAVVGVFGSAIAAGKLYGLPSAALGQALGIAASSAAGLFAFVNGGADVKRLHAGHAAREGLLAALLAREGIVGPPDVIEAPEGFMHAFLGRSDSPLALPPVLPFGITDCYIKPYPCCRHIQPAIEALIGILHDENIALDEVERVEVSTYGIAAAHARTGWDDFASAQLSFPYLMALAVKYRTISLEHFSDAVRADEEIRKLARKVTVSAPAEIDRLYPRLRPALVTVATARGAFTRQADEALGSRMLPLDDAALEAKFLGLVAPVFGKERAHELARRLGSIEELDDVGPLVEALAKPGVPPSSR